MSEQKTIAVFKNSNASSFLTAFYKKNLEKPLEADTPYLYKNGDIYRVDWKPYSHITDQTGLHNQGPVHPDDWYWNEDEKRLKEMSTLPEEEYLEVSMSDAIRITISEWDELAYSKAIIAQRQAYEKSAWEMALQRHQSDKEALALGTPSRLHRP